MFAKLKTYWAQFKKAVAACKKIRELRDSFPGTADEESLRAWCRIVCANAGIWAQYTDTLADDELITAADKLLENDAAWSVIYTLIKRSENSVVSSPASLSVWKNAVIPLESKQPELSISALGLLLTLVRFVIKAEMKK